jgi:hypothetical protein
VGAIEERDPAPAETVRQRRSEEPAQPEPPPGGTEELTEESGAALFPQLVWAHYRWERKLHSDDGLDAALEQAYRQKLSEFQRMEGQLEQVYWSTRRASAVAMTVKPDKPALKRLPRLAARVLDFGLRERRADVRLHRVTDWVTQDASRVADLLHECDLLALRVSEVLRGTTEQIALRWILGIEMHLLGFFERKRPSDEKSEDEFVKVQRGKLAECKAYYHRAASRAGRIVYVSGMFIGIGLTAVFGLVVGLLLWAFGLGGDDLQTILLCYGAGAVGALVSAMSRMSGAERGRFNIDFELGRPLMRRLGVYRPFVGGAIGVVLYFLLASELLDIKVQDDVKPYYYGFAAFLSGFSERFATVILGAAEQRLAPGGEQEEEPEQKP